MILREPQSSLRLDNITKFPRAQFDIGAVESTCVSHLKMAHRSQLRDREADWKELVVRNEGKAGSV